MRHKQLGIGDLKTVRNCGRRKPGVKITAVEKVSRRAG